MLRPKADPVPILLICSFFFSVSMGAVNYSILFYLKDLFQADKGLIGLAVSLQGLVYVAAMLILLKWNLRSFRTGILTGILWAPICIAVYLVVPFLGVTLVFHAVFGVSMALFWPRMGAWISKGKDGADLGRIMGRFNLAWSSGGILAPLMGGLLLTADVRLPFIVGIVMAVLIFAVAYLGLAKDLVKPAAAEKTALPRAGSFKTPLRFPARLGMISLTFFVGTLMNIYPVYARDAFHINEALIATFLMARMTVNALGFILWSRLKFWHFQPWVIPGVQAGLALLALLFPLAGNPVLVFILYAFVGALFSFQYSFVQFHNNAGYNDRTRGNTLHEIVINTGYILGNLTCGWVSETFSMNAAFVWTAGVVLALGIAQLVLLGPRLKGGKAYCQAEVQS